MVNIVCITLDGLDLKLKANKSGCIRIGKRYHAECVNITSSFGPIPWGTQISYLGVNIVAAQKISVCYDKPKSNFYSSVNAIYGKLGLINDTSVSLNLISLVALPCLLYAQEALPLTNAICRSIELPWSSFH